MNLFNVFTSILYLMNNVMSVPHDNYMEQYNKYIDTYNKSFSHDNFLIYKENVNYVENFKSDSFNVSLNHLSDLNYNNHLLINDTMKCNHCFIDNDTIVPLSVDWRKKNAVTNVKNQGHCGGCWSFSATGAIEGITAIKTGNLYNISEQQLIDCSREEGNNGCGGGMMDNAFNYIINNDGICSEEEYPFTGENGLFCKQCDNIVKISSYSDVTPNDERILKRAVAQQPISVAIQANLTSFQLYSGGIYNDFDCGSELDHGVLIVGYGTEMLKGIDYWIVKNSWGPEWGENGYIKIQRNIEDERGLCGIAMQASYPIV